MSVKITISIVFGLSLCLLCDQLCAQRFEKRQLTSLEKVGGQNGIAVADFDQDGDLDVVMVERSEQAHPRRGGRTVLLANQNNGSFLDVTVESGISTYYNYGKEAESDMGTNKGAAWADFNNDGYPDLFLTMKNRCFLYKNLGGHFIDMTEQAGLPRIDTCNNAGSAWLDYDNDGLLDVFVSKYGGCSSNRLFHNNGNETFTEVSEAAGVGGEQLHTWMALPVDHNEDGWMDLLVINEFSTPNELFINQQDGSFMDEATDANILDIEDSMGSDLGDVDGDGDLDVYITSNGLSSLFIKEGNAYIDRSGSLGTGNAGWGWATRFFDFDLDTDLDILAVNGYIDTYVETSRLFENQLAQGELRFQDVALNNEMTRKGVSFGSEVFDYDNDGDLDLIEGNAYGSPQFFENRTIEQADLAKHWLQIELVGVVANRDAYGAVVSVTHASNTWTGSNHGVGFLSQSKRPIHFGFGEYSGVVDVVVRWPGGAEQSFRSVGLDQFVRITEGDDDVEVLMRESSTKPMGCTDPHACNYDDKAVQNDGSCEYLPQPEIIGETQSRPLSRSVYGVQNAVGDFDWQWGCTQGKIVNGQGTPQIEVEWGVAEQAEIMLTQIGECHSESARLGVSLDVQSSIEGNHSVARLWNELLLGAIRKDYARPTVHARNLFHTSVVMYDVWAAVTGQGQPYFLGNQWGNYQLPFEGFATADQTLDAHKAISYAMYRLLTHRFKDSPGAEQSLASFDELMAALGYDPSFLSTDYHLGDAGALGNYVAQGMIAFGLQDGSNELNNYANRYYRPVNDPMNPFESESILGINPNRWQPLAINGFIDQSGNNQEGGAAKFLSPEWGRVQPFALNESDLSVKSGSTNDYWVYHDPGSPPLLTSTEKQEYQWGFSMVSVWGGHLDPSDGVMWDISPGGIGNVALESIPSSFEEYDQFYAYQDGGDTGLGRETNPVTGAAYKPNRVPRGDYTRVLAEFWADGPDSETPPGHWFTLLNYVHDHEQFEAKMEGIGETLAPLEWDVKAYFALGGAMHDAAIAAWGIKGWYDYVRPVTAIRYMAERGQSSDVAKANYHERGMPLVAGRIELIEEGDPLAGDQGENLGQIKLYSWRGHNRVSDPATDVAGAGWILAKEWWPYQRPSFVTPPFAGYISGHSTYSRAAAEVLTRLTGSSYFPGGMGVFIAKKDEFLVFEKGPSVDVALQWATYQDASDQCSLSRIWGGIHPPADDIPGRKIGALIGNRSFEKAKTYFNSTLLASEQQEKAKYFSPFPNPVHSGDQITLPGYGGEFLTVYDMMGRKVYDGYTEGSKEGHSSVDLTGVEKGLYIFAVGKEKYKILIE
ncbi:Por secretion system C-terminal sorting domain-containing protein [Reichenbachiella agariperforans]|uniref:Por secretion system C-terminal sorting domain-containing protein n=1 Tax=Reichenbachiella agariperforans TaxID=156994 RepID=A0A1M6UIK1_REIAG|nr:Por secretion system C-terminal sorting domain-containing protein [Reichenbachiella agariperforans]